MTKFWRALFVIILVWSIYHLIRDIGTDILGIHNGFLDFGHRQYPGVYWCGRYCQYTTFPLVIFNIAASSIILKRSRMGILGALVLLTMPIWLWGWLAGEGPLFP